MIDSSQEMSSWMMRAVPNVNLDGRSYLEMSNVNSDRARRSGLGLMGFVFNYRFGMPSLSPCKALLESTTVTKHL